MAEINDPKEPPDRTDPDKPKSAPGTEVAKKGGTESAKRQAQRDWEDSAKESGD